MLVDRVDKRLEREQKKYDAFISGLPMAKLKAILGEDLLDRIRNELPELYNHLMEYIETKKNINYAFARDLLAQYKLNLDEERRIERMQHGNERRKHLDTSFDVELLDESSALIDQTMIDQELQKTTNTKRETKGSSGFQVKASKKEKTQFVQWNFQRREKDAAQKKERLRKDHPSFNIVMKLLDKLKKGKEIKDLMPVKSLSRYLYNIYMAKAAEQATEKQNQLQMQRNKSKDRSISPDQKPELKVQKVMTNVTNESLLKRSVSMTPRQELTPKSRMAAEEFSLDKRASAVQLM